MAAITSSRQCYATEQLIQRHLLNTIYQKSLIVLRSIVGSNILKTLVPKLNYTGHFRFKFFAQLNYKQLANFQHHK